ncbi:MAG: hypothetical protein EB084_12355 [Proteobacteria bacterium]|nr:hypothetical protein [Pseudomonadota bacterium]
MVKISVEASDLLDHRATKQGRAEPDTVLQRQHRKLGSTLQRPDACSPSVDAHAAHLQIVQPCLSQRPPVCVEGAGIAVNPHHIRTGDEHVGQDTKRIRLPEFIGVEKGNAHASGVERVQTAIARRRYAARSSWRPPTVDLPHMRRRAKMIAPRAPLQAPLGSPRAPGTTFTHSLSRK